MVTAAPTAIRLTCPRCKAARSMIQIDGGTKVLCSGCEWPYTIGTQAPTGTGTAIISVGGTAITVASGGASFTSGMVLVYDTGLNTEILTCAGGSTATNIPIAAATKAHAASVTFGQFALSLSLPGVGLEAVPAAPGYGF